MDIRDLMDCLIIHDLFLSIFGMHRVVMIYIVNIFYAIYSDCKT
jgi:hypothetical protein